MTELKELLTTANVRRALIIDDAYEPKPLAKDLAQDHERWGQFFEDLVDSDKASLTELYPLFTNLRADALRASDEFVEALWNGRSKIRPELFDPLFQRYNDDKQSDLAYLESLVSSLKRFEIECKTAGKSFQREASNADLIVIDLFLGSAQDDEAIDNSIQGLKEVIRSRQPNLPIVILMSRSSRLESKRQEFRDKSGLFESAFRILRKVDLAEEGKLARVLRRLAEHSADSRRLGNFLHAWQTGLSNASDRMAHLIRSLSLSDHAQIRQLLLSDEDEPPGSYLVDVFDMVLQHEVERESPIISAAIELNGLDPRNYPPPYVSGSPDLQALIYRCLFQNNERLRLSDSARGQPFFGDILRRKAFPVNTEHDGEPKAKDHFIANIGPLDVLIVLTPACDLQRSSAKRLLLLRGSLTPLASSNWLYERDSPRTAVFETLSNERFQIKWNLKDIETVAPTKLRELLSEPQGLEIVARMRQPYALELQQKLLSSLGRVGMLAEMPGTFTVSVEAYLPDPDGRLFKVDVPALSSNKGVCFVGRRDDEPATTLVLCEDACEDLCNVDLAKVHKSTAETIVQLRNSGDLLTLQRGIDVSRLNANRFTEILAPRPTGEAKLVIGFARKSGEWISSEKLRGNHLKQAGVVLVVTTEEGIRDEPPQQTGESQASIADVNDPKVFKKTTETTPSPPE